MPAPRHISADYWVGLDRCHFALYLVHGTIRKTLSTPKAMFTNDQDKSNDRSDESRESPWRPSRRTFLWMGAGAAAGALLFGRTCLYDADDWDGQVLGEWEAAVIAAAAMALIPNKPGELPSPGPSGFEVAHNVDRFLEGMPEMMLLEIHGMFGLIEHGTLLGGFARRFTRLDPAQGLECLMTLRAKGGKFAQAFKGIRDLCLLGWYSDRRTWNRLGYDGPLLDRPAPPPVANREHAGPYARLIAQPGTRPGGAL